MIDMCFRRIPTILLCKGSSGAAYSGSFTTVIAPCRCSIIACHNCMKTIVQVSVYRQKCASIGLFIDASDYHSDDAYLSDDGYLPQPPEHVSVLSGFVYSCKLFRCEYPPARRNSPRSIADARQCWEKFWISGGETAAPFHATQTSR